MVVCVMCACVYTLIYTFTIHMCIQFRDRGEYDLQLVACSGHGKNGAITVLQVWAVPRVYHYLRFWSHLIEKCTSSYCNHL